MLKKVRAGAPSGALALLLGTLFIGSHAAGCQLSCPTPPCPSGDQFDPDSCTCVPRVTEGSPGHDAGLSCHGPVTCGAAPNPPCDWETARNPRTWCAQGPSPGITTSVCDDGYSALMMSGVDSAIEYLYRDSSLVAVVDVQADGTPEGIQRCGEGPDGFKIPTCGGFTFLCPGDDASTSDPEPEGGASVECDGAFCGGNENGANF